MDKKVYIRLRKQLNLNTSHYFTIIFFVQELSLICLSSILLAHFSESLWIYLNIPIFATIMFRNFSLMHEAVHGLLSKNKSINNAMGIWAGGFCLLPVEPWKRVHLDHHFWSGNVEKDPVMILMKTFPTWNHQLQSTLGFLWKAWFPILAISQYGVFWILSFRKFLTNPTCFKLARSLAFPFVFCIGICFTLGLGLIVKLLIPAVLLYLLMVEVVNFPHHLGLADLEQDHHSPMWEQHLTSRSCIYPLWLSKFVVLNFNYHVEHHMFPDAPWYRLESIYKIVSGELDESYNSDPQFAWIKKNRSKNLTELFTNEKKTSYKSKRAG